MPRKSTASPHSSLQPWKKPPGGGPKPSILSSAIARRSFGSAAIAPSTVPSTDHISLPPESAFKSPQDWASVALHEMSHWAASPDRLNRDLSGRFGSEAYAREELVAVLSSLIIGTELNLPTDIPNHASYIQSWIKILKNDRREIFRAAAAAQKCADYCLGFHPDYAASVTHSADTEPQDEERSLAA